MLQSLHRKARQLVGDPVLRRWMALRILRLTPGEPEFTAHRPPYLGAGWSGLPAEIPTASFADLPAAPPSRPIRLRLSGAVVDLGPDDFSLPEPEDFGDLETALSFHRFAWVPQMEADDDPHWLGVLWQAWMERFGTPDGSWAWHPYTAAERAVNLLSFARRHGLPGPAEQTLRCLAAHGPAMASGLEYFGDHHTSNHLANNGRGLYLLGLGLGLPLCADLGARILTEEGERIFRPSGVLREGSTHYHLLLTRSWAEIWLAAHAHGRPEAARFAATLDRALAVLPHFALPGRLPLVGDVSPDCPPAYLAGLLPGGDDKAGWMGLLPPDEHAALAARREATSAVDGKVLAADGWLRRDLGQWSGLWHADPEGFSHMPGHGHQDCGSFELHHGGLPLFIDPGRGSYRVAGEADEYVSARAHNGLCVDGVDPYPANKPYYAPAFRRNVAGSAPLLQALGDGVGLEMNGFARQGGIEAVRRRWRFAGDTLAIRDEVEGAGRHEIVRRLTTTLMVERIEGGLLLSATDGGRFKLMIDDGEVSVHAALSWTAYGEAETARRIEISRQVTLPWSGTLRIEVA
jgi:hypothetical protein